MEVVSRFDSAEGKSSSDEGGSSEPLRPLHLPRAAVKPPESIPPPRPPEMPSTERAVEAAKGVLLFSRQAAEQIAEQAQAAKATSEAAKLNTAEDDDEDSEDEQRARPRSAQSATAQPTTGESGEETTAVPTSDIEFEEPRAAAETPPPVSQPVHPAIPRPRQEVFAYPEPYPNPSTEVTSVAPPAEQSPSPQIAFDQVAETAPAAFSSEALPPSPLETYTPEPLPPIAGETNPVYETEESVPTAHSATPASHTRPFAATPSWTPNQAPTPSGADTGGNTPPPPGHPGPGGGGPPFPPVNGPNAYPGGGGPENYDATPIDTAPDTAQPPIPPAASGRNANVSTTVSYNTVRAADWPARLIGLAGFISSRRTRRKLGKRIDKVESDTKRTQEDTLARQRRFESEQRRHNTEIGRLQTDQQRLAQERQRMQPEAATSMPPVFNAEQQKQEEVLKQQGMELQPNQHVEHSAWHSIVVNEHGKAVQDAMQYGEGFRRERQQEAIQDQTGAMAGAGAAMGGALGTGAGVGATQSVSGFGGTAPDAVPTATPAQQYGPIPPQTTTSSYQSLPSGMTTPTLQPGPPTHVDVQHQLPAQTDDKRPVSGLAFWIMLAIIIVAFFAAALI